MLQGTLIASPQLHVDKIPAPVRGMFEYHLGGEIVIKGAKGKD